MVVSAGHYLGDAVAVEVGDDVGRVDPAVAVLRPVEKRPITAEDIDVVVRGHQLVVTVSIEIGLE